MTTIKNLFVFIALALPLFAPAQKAELRFYSIADGLPQNIVFSIAQDARGFIWVNAGQYLTRFDGANFVSHTNSNHPVFSRNRTGFAEMQTDGDLLVYCGSGQIGSTNTLTGEETAVQVTGLLPGGYDANYGHCTKLENGAIVAMYPDEAAGKVALLWLEKGRITHLTELSGVNAVRENFYYTFHGDAQGNLFMLNAGYNAILKFDRNGVQVQSFPVSIPSHHLVTRILPGRNNSVLLVVGKNIFRLEQGASAFQPHPANPFIQIGSNQIYDLVETPDGNFWAACSERHLLFYDAKQDKVVDYNQAVEGLIQNQATLVKMFFDKSGAIWITTMLGILRVMPNTALFDTYFTTQHALCGGYCSFRGFAEDGSGGIYASFYNNIFKINGPADRQGKYSALYRGEYGPFDLLFYQKNLLLNSGYVLNLQTQHLNKPFPNTLYTYDWGVFAYDTKGRVWWASGNKIMLLDDAQGSPVWKEIANVPVQGTIADIAFDAHNGLFWLGIEGALWTLDPATGNIERHGENLSQMLTQIKCIYPDGKGGIWIGTEKGLTRYECRPGKWQRYAQADGLPNDIVVGILPEGDSCLWLSTYNGLSRFSIRGSHFLNFYKQDGLADNEFNRASHFKARDGRMYFGGIKGVTAFYPQAVMANFSRQQSADKLLLQSITLTEEGSDSTDIRLFPNPAEPLHIYHRNRTIFFDFGLLNTNPNTLYSYQLDGQNKNWSVPSRDNDLLFNSLPSGKYTFRVRATDTRGNWLSEEIAFPLIVHPPWWASWWAYVLYALAVAGLAYGIFLFLKKRWELRQQLASEQQEAERLKELDTFKSELFTNITHEFRTPLTVILGMAERLTEDTQSPALGGGRLTADETKKGLNLIERNGQNLLRLINQLLDLSKLENKSFQLRLSQGNIVPYLRYVTESFHSFANVRNLSLRFFTTVEQLDMDFDPEQVQQVMSNLLSNALKFTPSGGEISVRIEDARMRGFEDLSRSGVNSGQLSKSSTPQILIAVSDTGIGIPVAELPHIFDRFYQVDGSATRPGEGTGIGLAHAQELVRLMGGNIAVESTPGAGSTFTIRLPVRLSEGAKEKTIRPFDGTNPSFLGQKGYEHLRPSNPETPVLPEATPTDPDRPLLLLIEDNPDVVDYLKTVLAPVYQLDIAFNGRIGIEKALETIPNLIISDVMMPEKDGYQVLDALKNDLRTSHIPIMMLTAKADATSKLAGLRRGADAYLPKPFVKAELLATLSMMRENRQRMKTYFMAATQQYTAGPSTPTSAAPIVAPTVEADVAIEDVFLKKVRDIVAANYTDEHFALPQLCETIGMSRSQLFRKMKALIDESPSDFIRNYRMQQARQLLQTKQFSVKEVAYKVGFKDLSHFSRTFQDFFGVSAGDLSN